MITLVSSFIIVFTCFLSTFNPLSATVEQGTHIYSHELAQYQLRCLDNIMSNEQALQLLSHQNENGEIKMLQNSTPEYLYKIVSQEQWQKSQLHNNVIGSVMDEKFIHIAKEDQVQHVAGKFWADTDYVLLKIASKKLIGRLIYEANPGGSTLYYHLYEGNIPLEAVVEVSVVCAN